MKQCSIRLTRLGFARDEQKSSVREFVDGPYNDLLTVNISAMVEFYNEFHACFRC
jgi:hypothetical protein